MAVPALLTPTACARKPLLDYSLDTPPVVLVPIRNAGITDGRARFREIFCAIQQDHGALLPDDRPCDEALHRLEDEPEPGGRPVHLGAARLPLRLIIVTGLMCQCVSDLVIPFTDARPHVESLGFKTDLLMVGGLSGIEENAAQIRDFVAEMSPAPQEKLIFVGFSKGAADLLEAVVRYADVRERTTAIVSLAGAIGGSPIAGALPDYLERWAEKLFGEKCGLEDGNAIESLSREARRDWLADNPLPRSIPYYSLAAFAERDNTSFILRSAYDRLAMVDPLNDGQVIFYDAVIPGSTLLGFVNADHWAVAMPIAREHPHLAGTLVTRNAFPREVLLEAIARFVEEDLLAGQPAD